MSPAFYRREANRYRLLAANADREQAAQFRRMAAEHHLWIADLFSDLTPKDVRDLMRLLARTKGSARKSAQKRAL